MRGSPGDRASAASVTSTRAVTKGRCAEGAAGCTSDAGTVGGAAKEAGVAAAAPVAPPSGAERTCVVSDAGPEIATEDDADVLTSSSPPGTQTGHPALCPPPKATATRRRPDCSLAGRSGQCGNVGDEISGAGVAEPSKTEAGKPMRQPERRMPAGRGGPPREGRRSRRPPCDEERGREDPLDRASPRQDGKGPEGPPCQDGRGPEGPLANRGGDRPLFFFVSFHGTKR